VNVNAARLEDRLGPFEPKYKSRGEAQVGRLLDRYGIPFIYEHPTLVYDRSLYRVWHPDFTLPGYKSLIVEYAGMPDIPGYMNGIHRKQQVYKSQGKPALFIYPEDLKDYHWPEKVVKRIYNISGRYRTFTRYQARSAIQRPGTRPPSYHRPRGYRR